MSTIRDAFSAFCGVLFFIRQAASYIRTFLWALLSPKARLAARLLAARYLVLGAATTLVLAAAVWGHRSIGPDTIPGWYPEYVSTVGALGWYLVLSGYLMVSGWQTLTMGGR